MRVWYVIAVLACAARARAQAPEAAPQTGAAAESVELSTLMDSAVVRLVAAARTDAQRLLAQKQYPEALKALETAHELDPRDLDTTQRLAELQHALGHAERAEPLYRELLELAPERGSSYLALADLLARERDRPERLAEAAELYARAQERLGADSSLLLRKARLAAARGLFADAERDYSSYLAKTHPDAALALELGDFYRDAGRPEDALGFYRQVSGGEPARVAAQRMFELEVDKEARRYGLSRRDAQAAQQAGEAAQKARLLLAQGQLAAAETQLRDALRLAPGRASLRSDLGDVLHAAGRDDEAELEYLRAIALDGSQPDVYLRLSELYLASKPLRATEAAWLLERALAVRPEWTRPHLLLARAYREQGDLPRALLHATRYLAQSAPGPEREEALGLQASLQAALGASEPAAAAVRSAASSGADHLARARALLARGQTDAALAELRRMEGSGLGAEALDLQARVLYAAGRLDEAARLLRSSLRSQPRAWSMHELLGEILQARGESALARSHWLQCERAGNRLCAYRLARLDAAPTAGPWGALHDLARAVPLWRARQRLAGLSEEALPASPRELTGLSAELEARLRVVAALGACAGLLLALFAVALQRARWGGLDLAGLLARHPHSAPEVQRVLSAIRHEVLKHNTLMLAGVAGALQRGAPAQDAAEHIARALFGADGQGGAAQRLDGYAAELGQIARAHGERVNLTRRDPALSALYAGFGSVRRVRQRLLAVERSSPAQRRRLAKRLLRANEQLNVRGQAELLALLDTLRTLRLTAPLLAALFDRVRQEPALATAPIEPLALDPVSELPCSIAIPAQAFDDILANLFRNALQASLRHDEPRPVVVGLAVGREIDPITGLTSVVLRVRDRAPEALDPARLRGGYIEAGLGLTADLVARHEGRLDVAADEPGFRKAVVLRLPAQRSEAP